MKRIKIDNNLKNEIWMNFVLTFVNIDKQVSENIMLKLQNEMGNPMFDLEHRTWNQIYSQTRIKTSNANH
jgi:hypothetical protein